MRLRFGAVVLVGIWILAVTPSGFGGGGGENLLMVVNPDSEAALRIANAYAKLRAVPDANIVFIAPPTALGYPSYYVVPAVFTSSYIDILTQTMSARGLDHQIDYIATFGQPMQIYGGYKTANGSFATLLSFNYGLAMMTQLQRGLSFGNGNIGATQSKDRGAYYRLSELLQVVPPRFSGSEVNLAPDLSYTPGTNIAIHHSTRYPINPRNNAPPGYNYAQWYMTANTGNAGMFAQTTSQVIANLQYTVPADGTKPVGHVYFEESSNIRTATRSPYWGSVQKYMSANGIPWIQEKSFSSPHNRPDVRGAVMGTVNTTLPNGSTYLPGCYADNLTSLGGAYSGNGQVKNCWLLKTGAGGTAGTVTEPFAVQTRFTFATVFIFANDGSTLGEAHFKAIPVPDIDMLEGDQLSQAYADVPRVAFTSAPANYATVKGVIKLSASAALVPPLTMTATEIDHLELFVDGLSRGRSSGAAIDFSLDTTTLSDGVHEIRAVAYNNSAAQTQGYALAHVVVNNRGLSVVAEKNRYEIAWNQTIPVPISMTTGSGTVSALQLQCLGRVVASAQGGSGPLSLTSSSLAFGENLVVPVAVFSDGSMVQGRPSTVTRDFHRLPGGPVTPSDQCTPGFKFDFFGGAAGKTIATTSFSGTPTASCTGTILSIDPTKPTNMPDVFRYSTSHTNAGLAVRITTRMLVSTPGEYSFWFTTGNTNWDSFQFSIDGLPLMAHECWNGTTFKMFNSTADTTHTIYLEAGEHSLQVLLAAYQGTNDDKHGMFDFWYRGPDGASRQPSAADKTADVKFYTVN